MFDVDFLSKHGYVVIKDIIDNHHRQSLLDEFDRCKIDPGLSYFIKTSRIITCPQHTVDNVLVPVMSVIRRSTDIGVNHLGKTGVFFSTTDMCLPWHQDHEPYYMWQTAYHSVNFWIPLIKSDPNGGGLRVISQCRLRDHIGQQFDQRIKNQGAKKFIPCDDHTDVFDDETGEHYQLPINIDTIADAPEITPGDLMVLRGDVLHRTQSSPNTQRIAFATRAVDDRQILSKQRFLQRSAMKQSFLDSNPRFVQRVERVFQEHNQDFLPLQYFL